MSETAGVRMAWWMRAAVDSMIIKEAADDK